MDHISKDILKQITDKLETEKKRLEDELAKFASKNAKEEGDYEAEFPEYGDEEDDNALEVSDYSNKLSLERALEEQLKDVNRSLDRIKEGTYGICHYCRKPIQEKRLLIRPESGACIECKSTLSS